MHASREWTDKQLSAPKPETQPPKLICAIASGKGGVGKTTLTINLGVALASRGRRTLILDADLGLANIDVQLGIRPRFNLSHLLLGQCSIDDVTYEARPELSVIPAASGLSDLIDLPLEQQAALVNSFDSMNQSFDCMLIDSATGISGASLRFVAAAHSVVLVIEEDPCSLTDAYAIAKQLNLAHDVRHFLVIVNRTASTSSGQRAFERLNRVSSRFLEATFEYLGSVPIDQAVTNTVNRQEILLERFPSSRSASAIRKIAQRLSSDNSPTPLTGNIQYFLEKSIMAEQQAGALAV